MATASVLTEWRVREVTLMPDLLGRTLEDTRPPVCAFVAVQSCRRPGARITMRILPPIGIAVLHVLLAPVISAGVLMKQAAMMRGDQRITVLPPVW
jgi:hypothetical protein